MTSLAAAILKRAGLPPGHYRVLSFRQTLGVGIFTHHTRIPISFKRLLHNTNVMGILGVCNEDEDEEMTND